MDFYFKYRDYKRKLTSTFRHKGITINLYKISLKSDLVFKYVLTKNRLVICECNSLYMAEVKFFDIIYLENDCSPELFNP